MWFAGDATDEMRVERERRPVLGTVNRATLDGAHVDPKDHYAHLLAGFEAGYRLIMAHREDLVAADGPVAAFAGDVVRPILRHTAFYDSVLVGCWHPDVLRDGLDREYLLSRLDIGHIGLLGRDAVIASEVAQMSDRDIPAFSTTAGSRDLYDHRGLVVRGFRQHSGVDAVTDRVQRFSDADLDQRLWCIRASLRGLQVGGARARTRRRPGAAGRDREP